MNWAEFGLAFGSTFVGLAGGWCLGYSAREDKTSRRVEEAIQRDREAQINIKKIQLERNNRTIPMHPDASGAPSRVHKMNMGRNVKPRRRQ